MKTLRLLLVLITGLLVAIQCGQAQQMPQDNWAYETQLEPGDFRCLHIAKDDLIYVGTRTNTGINNVIKVYDTDLNVVKQFGPVGTVLGIASDSQTNIYVLETSTVRVFNPLTGEQIRQWGSAGTENGQFAVPVNASSSGWTTIQPQVSGIAIDNQDNVYIANGTQVLVMTTDGTYLRKWGPDTLGQYTFANTISVGLAHNRKIAVLHNAGFSPGTTVRYQLFNYDGAFIRMNQFTAGAGGSYPGGRSIVSSPDGLLFLGLGIGGGFQVCDTAGVPLFTFSPFTHTSLVEPTHDGVRVDGAGFSSNGTFYVVATSYLNASGAGYGTPKGILKRKRVYSGNSPIETGGIPQPRLVKVSQRASTSLIDLDIFVRDSDSSNVSVGLLGFTNGVNSLTGLIKLNTFVESTAANLGPSIPANTTNRITWDAAADWNVGFGNIQFEVLARDERGMLPFHFITIPAGAGGVDPLKVSDKPVTDADLLSVWFWLIASNDSEIQFINGEVFGTGINSAKKYATGITTTADGRTYIFGRLGVRAIDFPPQGEVVRANAGRYGFPAAVTASHVVKLP